MSNRKIELNRFLPCYTKKNGQAVKEEYEQ